MSYDNEILKRTEKIEKMQLELLEKRREAALNELDIRSKLSFKMVEPEFEYENEPSYLAVRKKALEIAVEQELIDIQNNIDKIELRKLEREEFEKKQNE